MRTLENEIPGLPKARLSPRLARELELVAKLLGPTCLWLCDLALSVFAALANFWACRRIGDMNNAAMKPTCNRERCPLDSMP